MSLFRILKDLFDTSGGQSENAPHHPQLGRVVLLLEAAIYDADFAAIERETIEQILRDHYQLSEPEAHELIDLAAQHRERFPDIHSFTREIAGLPRAERVALMEEIWLVIYADKKIEATEEHYARKMKKLLRLDHSDWVAAKQRVAHGKRLGEKDSSSS